MAKGLRMTGFIKRKKHWFCRKKGFYTVEAAIFLPVVILAVLTVGYFTLFDMSWENAMNGAFDESSRAAAYAKGNLGTLASPVTLEKRVEDDESKLYNADIERFSFLGSGRYSDVSTFHVSVKSELKFPLGLGRDFEFDSGVRYRGFVGEECTGEALGSKGLETSVKSEEVWIFPQSGARYHKENCTYVKASVHSCILTESIRQKHPACDICDSESIGIGSIVYCFDGNDTAYHRGNCRTINRHVISIDKNEAEKKGYTPCTKCGG